jgi:hypothetical protein
MVHVYQCVVHEPTPIYLQPYHFKKPPNKVTEGNKFFWSLEVEVEGSICKKCWNKFAHRSKDEVGRVDILSKDSNVCISLLYSLLGARACSGQRFRANPFHFPISERFIIPLFI